jgi:hypothetical protein
MALNTIKQTNKHNNESDPYDDLYYLYIESMLQINVNTTLEYNNIAIIVSTI